MIAITAFTMFVLAGIIWLFFNYGIDKIKHPEEWRNVGSSGERILYNTLVRKFNIPERQIFRNVYIPKKGGRTSEIDLLVVSRKGIFVFESKNYSGKIYGDALRAKWIQYLGGKKTYFYSPLAQNKNHAKHLREFLVGHNIEVPVVPLVSVSLRGDWKIRNLGAEDYVLGINCHLEEIYKTMPDVSGVDFSKIARILAPLSRPGDEVRERHIEEIQNRRRR